jgi:hypothetical protein
MEGTEKGTGRENARETEEEGMEAVTRGTDLDLEAVVLEEED